VNRSWSWLDSVLFKSDNLHVGDRDDELWIAMAPLCRAVGVDHRAQIQRLRAHTCFAGGVALRTHEPKNATSELVCMQTTWCMRFDMVGAWLMTVSADGADPRIRENLLEFQAEARKAVFELVMGGREAMLAAINLGT
jgi:hypothetical protein